jgi:hypothetical protein
VFFFFPGMVLIFYAGTVEASHAWEIVERVGGGGPSVEGGCMAHERP